MRASILEILRGELIGPTRANSNPQVAEFNDQHQWIDEEVHYGSWCASNHVINGEDRGVGYSEIRFYDKESSLQLYGAGILHPIYENNKDNPSTDSSIPIVDPEPIDENQEGVTPHRQNNNNDETTDKEADDDPEIPGHIIGKVRSMGISFFCPLNSSVTITLPREKKFDWQDPDSSPFPLNGIYGKRKTTGGNEVWIRKPFSEAPLSYTVDFTENDQNNHRYLAPIQYHGITLRFSVNQRKKEHNGTWGWLVTITLINQTEAETYTESIGKTLFQALFTVSINNGNESFLPYPESTIGFDNFDQDQQSLSLLYQNSKVWGIGHGCSATWPEMEDQPTEIVADVFPTVQTPNMTPDILLENGAKLSVSLLDLVNLECVENNAGYDQLQSVVNGYSQWIEEQRNIEVPDYLADVKTRHLNLCEDVSTRLTAGLQLLENDDHARNAFRLANLAMLFQQIATKELKQRFLVAEEIQDEANPFNQNNARNNRQGRGRRNNNANYVIRINGEHVNPLSFYNDPTNEGVISQKQWRPFQIAFFLMVLPELVDGNHDLRDAVDLIWFPTGGGKTEAYLSAMAFYMFHQRILQGQNPDGLERDGCNVLMRYTLRMLTSQQFQRAAGLITAMEFIRRDLHNPINDRRILLVGFIPEALEVNGDFNHYIAGERFSIGMWIGGDSTPNKHQQACNELARFQNNNIENPFVISECPWCRSQIGKLQNQVHGIVQQVVDGINKVLFKCSDDACRFGSFNNYLTWLPIEVVDEAIYENPPSLLIGTADKYAMIAYQPDAARLFGKVPGDVNNNFKYPPQLIIQDEFHLISGPLGSLYGLYETLFEQLCTYGYEDDNGNQRTIKPKIVCSTATIRAANEQIRQVYGREKYSLFPPPGITISDSYFGRYHRDDEGNLTTGRRYVGIYAPDFSSILTANVRLHSALKFAINSLPDDNPDSYRTLLAFYNSIRELSISRTLFDIDIEKRTHYLYNREYGYGNQEGDDPRPRTYYKNVKELTSRLKQSEIVKMLGELQLGFPTAGGNQPIDVCLASNIIEVGVDVDRLCLMSIIGQPKSTAQYIQVSGRVGRDWLNRPGLVLTVFNPNKTRDRNHFELFASYHKRLYEHVEPSSVTPFSTGALRKGLAGIVIAWIRLVLNHEVPQGNGQYENTIDIGIETLLERLNLVYPCCCNQCGQCEQKGEALSDINNLSCKLKFKLNQDFTQWNSFAPQLNQSYAMIVPGSFYTAYQKQIGSEVMTSLRNVDTTSRLDICSNYNQIILEENQ